MDARHHPAPSPPRAQQIPTHPNPTGRFRAPTTALDTTYSQLGQTGVDTLGPLGRSVHRAATHGRWKKRQPSPGTFLFRSPLGWVWIVTNQGTIGLGNTDYARAAWAAAAPSDHVIAA